MRSVRLASALSGPAAPSCPRSPPSNGAPRTTTTSLDRSVVAFAASRRRASVRPSVLSFFLSLSLRAILTLQTQRDRGLCGSCLLDAFCALTLSGCRSSFSRSCCSVLCFLSRALTLLRSNVASRPTLTSLDVQLKPHLTAVLLRLVVPEISYTSLQNYILLCERWK